MTSASQINLSQHNYLSYQELLAQIEASIGIFSILIAVCDDRDLQKKLITEYERELSSSANCYQVKLDNHDPSIKTEITKLLSTIPNLNSTLAKVITVIGANNLSFVGNKEQGSEQDQFFGYLQWTREGLREFNCPIVLWISTQILVNIRQKAPDFWSWRKGVFKFESEPKSVNNLPSTITSQSFISESDEKIDNSDLSLEDLQELIANTESKRGKKEPTLVSLYHRLGKLYVRRLKSGEAKHYADEKERAKICFTKAIDLATELGLRSSLINILIDLGLFYQFQAKYQLAIEYWKKSWEIAREEKDCHGEASSLLGLGNAYYLLGEYQRAIDYYQESLEIFREIGNRHGVASPLIGLGSAYNFLGEYQRAIDYLQQCLEIQQQIGDRQGVANSLGNLGTAYHAQGEYQRAIDYLQQSLEIKQQIGDRCGVATALNNLGNTYYSLGEYQRAIDYHQQSLEIQQQIGDRHGVATALNNLGQIANSLMNLGNACKSLGEHQQAIDYLQQSSEIRQQIVNHHREAKS